MDERELEGLTVLEIGDFIPAAFCGKVLADLGAEVVKVEVPGAGDESRRFGPFPGDEAHPERSGLFLYLNANKKSVTLNLDEAEGQDVLRRVASTMDVLVEDTPPRYMEQRGLDYPALQAANQELIVVSISAFGRTGPYRDYAAYDLQMWHGSGAGHRFLGEPGREPLRAAWYMASHWAAWNAAGAVILGLFARDITGRGQFIDVSGAESIAALSTGSAEVTAYREFGDWRKRQGSVKASGVPSGMLRARDGYINIMALTPQQWDSLVRAMGSPEWAMNPAYQGQYVDRVPYAEEIYGGMERWLSERTVMEAWRACLDEGVPAAPVSSTKDLLENEHLEARGFFVECDHPEAGPLKMPGGAIRTPGVPLRPPAPAPLLGQHTAEVLTQRLGLSSVDLDDLKRRGII